MYYMHKPYGLRRQAWFLGGCLFFLVAWWPGSLNAQPHKTLGVIDPLLEPISFTDQQGKDLTLYAVSGLSQEKNAYNRTLGWNREGAGGLRNEQRRKEYYEYVLQQIAIQEEFAGPDFLYFIEEFSESPSPFAEIAQEVLPEIPETFIKTFTFFDDPIFENLFHKHIIKLNYIKSIDLTTRGVNKVKHGGRWIRQNIQNGAFDKAFGFIKLLAGTRNLATESQRIYATYLLLKAFQMDLALDRLRYLQQHSTLYDPAFREALNAVIREFELLPNDTWRQLLQAITLHADALPNTLSSLSDIGEGMLLISQYSYANWVGAVLFTVKTGLTIDKHQDLLRTSALAATIYKSLDNENNFPAYLGVSEYCQVIFLRDLKSALGNNYMKFLELIWPSRVQIDENGWELIRFKRGDTRRFLDDQLDLLLKRILERRLATSEPSSSSSSSLALALLLDSSGSMRENDPQRLRVEAARLTADKLPNGASLALLDFDENTLLLHPMAAVDGNRLSLKRAGDRLDADGGTNIGAAIRAAARLLSATTTSTRAAILLTDGKGTYEDQGRLFVQNGWRLYTIGLGAGINIRLLASLAQQSGAQYFKATTAADLGPILDAILSDLTGNALVATFTDHLDTQEQKSFPFYLDDTATSLSGLLTWTSGSLRIWLRDPTGQVVHPQISQGQTYAVFHLPSPQTGRWQAVAEAPAAPVTSFHLQLSSQSPLRPLFRSFPTALRPGSGATIRLILPLFNIDTASLSAAVHYLSSDETNEVTPLHAQPDTKAIHFVGQLRAGTTLGDQRVRVEIKGYTRAGAPFQRFLERTFTVTNTADAGNPLLVSRIVGGYLEITGAQQTGLQKGLLVRLLAPNGDVLGTGYITSVIADQAIVEIKRLFVDSLDRQSFTIEPDSAAWRGDIH